MKLDEAIEIKEANLRGDEPDDTLDLITADRLSIEALKRVKKMRTFKPTPPGMPLPGETPD